MPPLFQTLRPNNPGYPRNIKRCLEAKSPSEISYIGSKAILDKRLTALFCSSKCPGVVLDRTYDLAQRLRAEGRTVISGFHSPLEKTCLEILLRSPHSVVLCPARGLGSLRLRPEWKRPLAEGRLLILSPFPPNLKRGTAADARFRNRFAAALADEIIIAHAAPGSQTQRLADEIISWGKPVVTP